MPQHTRELVYLSKTTGDTGLGPVSGDLPEICNGMPPPRLAGDSNQRCNQTAAHPTKRPISRGTETREGLSKGKETPGYSRLTVSYLGARHVGDKNKTPRSAAMAPRSPCRAGRGR